MLSLLSRAAHTSHCSGCLRPAQDVARKAATARSVLRPRHLSICRAWSTCNNQGAAASAARSAPQKRQQWSQAVDGHRPEPGSLTSDGGVTKGTEARSAVEGRSRTGAQEAGEHARADREVAVSTAAETAPVESLEVADDLEAELERNLDSTADRENLPVWPTNTGPPLQRHHLPPQSIYAYQGRKRGAAKMRWYEKKVLRVQLAMDMLQLRFFMWLHERGRAYRLVSSVPERYAAIILQHPRDLRRAFEQKKADFDRLLSTHRNESGDFVFERSTSDVPLCHYSEDETGIFRAEQRELQQTIKRSFDQLSAADMPGADIPGTAWALRLEGLVQIFWQLSASPAPPSLDVYNTLINGLRKEGHVALTENVISCFVSSRIRPNEVSLASILGFYTEIDNVERFHHWIRLMRGQRGGLMASAPWNLRFKASNGRIVQRDDKPDVLIQLPHPTPMVFDALVKGVLHFSGFGAALDLCRNLSDEGWGMDMRGFGILLNDCAIRGDWDAGFAVWVQILALKQKSAKLVDGRFKTEVIMTPLFADMLRLCRRCDKKHEFKDVWEQASKTHPRAVHHIMDLIKAESVSPSPPAEVARADTESTPAAERVTIAEETPEPLGEPREQTLEALARLRARNMDDITDRALRQEYLALQADVEFLKALETEGKATPQTHTWADLAKAAYSLIATHPQMLERRTPDRKHMQDRRARGETQTVSLADLAKSAYHLVADPSSAFQKRTEHAQHQVPVASADSQASQSSSPQSSAMRRSGTCSQRSGGRHDLIGSGGQSALERQQSAQLSESHHDADNVTSAQLHGHEGGPQELDDYEAGERPMSHKRS